MSLVQPIITVNTYESVDRRIRDSVLCDKNPGEKLYEENPTGDKPYIFYTRGYKDSLKHFFKITYFIFVVS